MKQDLLEPKELLSFLKSCLLAHTNKHNIKMELVNGTGITAATGLGFETGKGTYKMLLLTDPAEPGSFIEAFNLRSINGLQDVTAGMLWIRYLIGKAAVSYEVPELEATFTFRVVNSKTIIYCYALHFYDEEANLLTMEHQFEDYVKGNMARLEMAASYRMEWV